MAFVLRTSDGREFPLDDAGRIRIGSHAHCEVCLPATLGLSPVHAELKRTGGRWLLEGVGELLIRVDQKPAAGMAWLDTGAKIEFVGTGIQLLFAEARPVPVAFTPTEPATLNTAQVNTPPEPTGRPTSPPRFGQPLQFALGVLCLLALVGGWMWWSGSAGKTLATAQTGVQPTDPSAAQVTTPSSRQHDAASTPESTSSTSPAVAVTPAVPASSPGEPPVGGIVWIGLWYDGQSMICSGWVASPERIITVGRITNSFQEAQKKSAKIIVYCPGQAAPMIAVKSVIAHPDWENPDYDLAELVPETPLNAATVCRMAETSHLRAITNRTPLRAVGFEIPLREGEPFAAFNQLQPLERVLLSLELKEAHPVPGEMGVPTFIPLQQPNQIRQAWAVIDSQGAVIGTWIFRSNGEHRIIPIDRLPKTVRSANP